MNASIYPLSHFALSFRKAILQLNNDQNMSLYFYSTHAFIPSAQSFHEMIRWNCRTAVWSAFDNWVCNVRMYDARNVETN